MMTANVIFQNLLRFKFESSEEDGVVSSIRMNDVGSEASHSENVLQFRFVLDRKMNIGLPRQYCLSSGDNNGKSSVFFSLATHCSLPLAKT